MRPLLGRFTLILVLALTACTEPPITDAVLIAVYEENKKVFRQLVSMCYVDQALIKDNGTPIRKVTIGADLVEPRGQISPDRHREYHDLFRELRFPTWISCTDATVMIGAEGYGEEPRDWAKGYVFRPAEDETSDTTSSLDTRSLLDVAGAEDKWGLRQIEGEWYLYFITR